jgi:hypothetical protein
VLVVCVLCLAGARCDQTPKEKQLSAVTANHDISLNLSDPKEFVAIWFPKVFSSQPDGALNSAEIRKTTPVSLLYGGNKFPLTCSFIASYSTRDKDKVRYLGIVLHSTELGSEEVADFSIKACDFVGVDSSRFVNWKNLTKDINVADIHKPNMNGKIVDNDISISIMNSFDNAKPWLLSIECFFPVPLQSVDSAQSLKHSGK